jgi:aspartyl-tRNA(Asn)/glutamyl-tRNA(Gln) amidotransferase subunit C
VKIDLESVDKFAQLSRLNFDQDSKVKLTKELNVILDWVDKLNEVDTEGIEPLTSMTAETNIIREDMVTKGMSHEDGLKNAPKKDSNYFRVPKVLDKN